MMNIICITSNPQIDFIKKDLEKLGNLEVHNKQNLSESETIELAKNAEILIAGPSGIKMLSEAVFAQLPKLKLLATLTVNTIWIDLKAAKNNGVTVCNIKGANTESVAEHTWGMILDLAKRISEFDRDARFKGAYTFNSYKGKEVYGKTIGIIGLGDIGTKVARIAHAFDMKVVGINKSQKPVQGVELTNLGTLLSKSDVIAVCTPLTDETRDLINQSEINQMKNGVILVNNTVEEVVNKQAVIEGLKSGKIFGYGVETTIMQPIPKNDPYYDFPNVVLTPHNAFNTEDADKKSYDLVLENIQAFIKGKPQNVVSM